MTRPVWRTTLAWPLVLVLGLGVGKEASAILVTHEFSGVITLNYEPFTFPQYPVGTSFSGTLTYETDTPATIDPPYTAYIHQPPYDPAIGLDIVVDGQEYASDDTADFIVRVYIVEGAAYTTMGEASEDPTPSLSLTKYATPTEPPDDSLPVKLFLASFDHAELGAVVRIGSFSEAILNGPLDSLQTTIPNPCGDSVLDPIETCDDGNTTSGDGCSEICLREVLPVPAASSRALVLMVTSLAICGLLLARARRGTR